MKELKELRPYRKEPTVIMAGIQWYKVVDKNGVPLVNFDIAEDKADFICQCVNSHDDLLAACKDLITAVPIEIEAHGGKGDENCAVMVNALCRAKAAIAKTKETSNA